MAKKKLAIVMTVLFIFAMLPGLALGVQVSLDLSQNSAAVGDSITASGSADPVEWVSIKVVDSSGSIVFYDAVKSDAGGNYSCTFIVPQAAAGTLTVVAGYGSNVANKTLTIGDETAAVTGVSLNKSSTSIVKGADETLAAMVAPTNASNKSVTWSSNNEAVATVDGDGKVTAVEPGTAIITVITVDSNKTASCNVTVTKPETVTSGGTVTISDTPVTITVPQGETGSITVTQNTVLPLVEVNSDTVEMTIPQGTEVSGSDTIKLPEVMPSSSVVVPEAQQVDLVIKVGSDSDTITFSKPVRLVLKGQASKSAGFIDNQNAFREINKLPALVGLTSDADADAAALALFNAGVTEGAVASGNDLIIWTEHFTEFIAYTPHNQPVDECFIATAAFGSKFEPAVVLLRAFRDKFLLSNVLGRAFVDFYYRHSPPIADYIANSGFLKAGVRILLAPVIGVVYLLFHPLLMYAIIALLAFGIVMYRVRKRRVPSSC